MAEKERKKKSEGKTKATNEKPISVYSFTTEQAIRKLLQVAPKKKKNESPK